MAQYSNLKAYIEEKIYENGTQAITGDILQDVLKVMTDDLGEFYQTGGVASPSTDPGIPDAKVIYFATEAGTYTNFGGITLAAGEVALLIFETSWTKETLNVLSSVNGGVKTANLADGAVTTEKIAGGAVETAKIANNAVTSGKVADGAIGTAKIADGAIDADKIAANAVESAKIKNGAVTEGKINDGAVTADKVAANAVTTAKIADDAVTTAKLNDGAVTEDKIATDAVTSGKVKDGAIGTAKIAAGAVTHAKIGAGAVEESNIKDGAITSDKIADGAVGSDQLAEGAFSAENLADGSVTTDKLADEAVTAEKIADGAVTAGKFANGSVTTIKLGSGAVTTEKIGDGMVTRQKLADSSVGTSKIIDGAVTTDKVADGAITDAKLENPVSVSQNTETGDDVLNIGNEAAGSFADSEKLIELVGWGTVIEQTTGITGIGQYYYDTYDKAINKSIAYHNPPVIADFEHITFFKGAIYSYQNELYIWNGTDLVNKSKADSTPTPLSPNLVKSGGTNHQLDTLRGKVGEVVSCKQIIGGASNTPVQISDFDFKAGKTYNLTIVVANGGSGVNVVLRPSSDSTTYLKKDMGNGTHYYLYTPASDITGLYLSIYNASADVTITFVEVDNLSSKVGNNEAKLTEFDKYVGRYPAIKTGEILPVNEIAGGLNIVDNVVTPASSNNWRYCQWAATEKTWYAVETGMAARSIRTNPYVFATNDDDEILGMFFAPPVDETAMHQFPRMMIYLPEGTTKLWILRFNNASLSIYAEKANTLFNSFAEAINVVMGNILTTAQVESIAEATINDSDLLTAVISEYIAEHPETFDDAAMLQTIDVPVTVGTGGNYNTINSALDALSRLHKTLGIKATITLKTGFVIAEQITVDSTDMSWVDIVSEDAQVSVTGSAISAVNITVPSHTPYEQVLLTCVFAARNGATLPNIKFLMVVDNSGSNVTGIGVYNNSKAYIADNCGCNNAWVNLYIIEQGRVNAMGADFSYATGNGISCFRSSSIAFGGGKAMFCNYDGIYVDANSDADVSGANFSYAGVEWHLEGGDVVVDNALSDIDPITGQEKNNGAGIEVGPACKVQAGGAKANYCKRGIYAYNGGFVGGRQFTSIGCLRVGSSGNNGGMAIHCQSGARVTLPSSTINSCQYAEVLAENGAEVCVNGANASESVGCCVVARGGSKLQCINANCQRGASAHPSDIQCDTGSIIQATGATGGTTPATTNTITSVGLIIK